MEENTTSAEMLDAFLTGARFAHGALRDLLPTPVS